MRWLLQPALSPWVTTFMGALQRPREAQQALLQRCIRSLAATAYGQACKIMAPDDYAAFAAKVPLVGYDDLRPWIERQQSEEGHVLVAEPVLFYARTSGSSGTAKTIPYTRSLQRSFTRMCLIWIGDLLTHGPRFETGRMFLSMSPAFQAPQTTRHGKSIGLDDDTAYLTPWIQGLLTPFLVVSASIQRLHDPAEFRYALAVLLLAAEELEAMSIWNPTFLEVLLEYMQANAPALVRTLQAGRLTYGQQARLFPPLSQHRAELLLQPTIPWTQVWPHLKLISCWTNAHARVAAQRLRHHFPGVFMQGKGLLATEAPLTVPISQASGCVPLVSEVFYEFCDAQGNIVLLHELCTGQEYDIVLTQHGGLYRYRIGDRVRVTHFYRATPCLEFVGRSDAVCDLTGEKLHERFVRACLERLARPASGFHVLVPVLPARGVGYYLLIVDRLLTTPAAMATAVDEALCEAYHYRQARRLGQLGPVQVRAVPAAREKYYQYWMDTGMKWGDIKQQYLFINPQHAAAWLIGLKVPGTS
jgi:hypothetical protein